MNSGATSTCCAFCAADPLGVARTGRARQCDTYARFLPVPGNRRILLQRRVWTASGRSHRPTRRSSVPASARILAPRVVGYQPAMLDELLAAGEITWTGAGSISGADGWVAFHRTDNAPLTVARTDRDRIYRHPPRHSQVPACRRITRCLLSFANSARPRSPMRL